MYLSHHTGAGHRRCGAAAQAAAVSPACGSRVCGGSLGRRSSECDKDIARPTVCIEV
jgi:hypothetical protein